VVENQGRTITGTVSLLMMFCATRRSERLLAGRVRQKFQAFFLCSCLIPVTLHELLVSHLEFLWYHSQFWDNDSITLNLNNCSKHLLSNSFLPFWLLNSIWGFQVNSGQEALMLWQS
jgi:hypothetical protein